MTQLQALSYADWRVFINDVRRAIHSPGRMAVWLGYIVLLSIFFVTRVFSPKPSSVAGVESDLLRADYFMCALLAMLALALAFGSGAVGIFRSRAEARFIIGSPVAAPLAIAYLQVREGLAQGLRLLFSLVYFVFIFGPRRLGPLVVLADLGLVLAIISAAAAIVVPRRLLPPAAGKACLAVGVPLAFAALAPAVRDGVTHGPFPLPPALVSRVAAVIPAWHPGHVLLAPDPRWLLGALALAAAAIAILASAGRDAYPELYEVSIARIDRLERGMERLAGFRARRAASPARAVRRVPSRALPAPAGVWIFVWKSVVEFGRRTSPAYVLGGAALWCLGGFGAARLVAADQGAIFAAFAGVAINVMLLVGVTATAAIAGEVRRPLFWLAEAALFERLSALAVARIWRVIATLELVAAGFALGGGSLMETLVLAIGLPSLVALLAGVGFAVFALFPSSADQRGPVAAVRFGVSVLLIVPPLTVFVVAEVFGGALAGLGMAALLALIEAAALIGVAAWRLDGHIDRLAA